MELYQKSVLIQLHLLSFSRFILRLNLRQRPLYLCDTSGITWVSAHKLRSRAAFSGRHLLPEIYRDIGIISSHRHKYQSHIIRFRFMFA